MGQQTAQQYHFTKHSKHVKNYVLHCHRHATKNLPFSMEITRTRVFSPIPTILLPQDVSVYYDVIYILRQLVTFLPNE